MPFLKGRNVKDLTKRRKKLVNKIVKDELVIETN